jgi:hypothetical protein
VGTRQRALLLFRQCTHSIQWHRCRSMLTSDGSGRSDLSDAALARCAALPAGGQPLSDLSPSGRAAFTLAAQAAETVVGLAVVRVLTAGPMRQQQERQRAQDQQLALGAEDIDDDTVSSRTHTSTGQQKPQRLADGSGLSQDGEVKGQNSPLFNYSLEVGGATAGPSACDQGRGTGWVMLQWHCLGDVHPPPAFSLPSPSPCFPHQHPP